MEKKIILNAENGLHARPAGIIAKKASKFKSNITINGINAKSIMSLMSSAFEQGEELTVRAEGEDQETAVNAIVELIQGLE